MKSGIEYMVWLANWYKNNSGTEGVGFFSNWRRYRWRLSDLCVVPMLSQDLEDTEIPCWSYFCQISDSTTSFGSYSGAVPNEKKHLGQIRGDTPKFIIESDASIVAPLIFAYVLGL